MMKMFAFVCGICCCLMLQFCTASKSAASSKTEMPAKVVSYKMDVAPIMIDRCTPCHFPDGGKKKFLDTYAAVSTNIDDIIHRVQLPHDSTEFMPFKSKKPPLSDSLVNVLRVWKETGMSE
jgi:hypothetical protein